MTLHDYFDRIENAYRLADRTVAGKETEQPTENKEVKLTITNHIRLIEGLALQVIEHVDAREYSMAHVALDSIESKVRLAREHIDKLQQNAECAARPPGGS